MKIISYIVKTLVLPNVKAIVALLVSSILIFLSQRGIVVDDATQNALVAGIGGVLTASLVWLFPNK